MINVYDQVLTEDYAIWNGDCISVMKAIPDQSIGFIIFSPPFARSHGGLFVYSSDEHDLSNNDSYESFFEHYGFVTEQIARVIMPGRMVGIHCMDVPSGNSGNDHLIDFPGDIIRHMQSFGFEYTHRFCIWKEPLLVRNRTLAKGLFHQTLVEDSTRVSLAVADYLLMFRARGENPIPVAHPSGLQEYAGSTPMPAHLLKFKNWKGKQIENQYSHWIWRQYASSFWNDVRIDRVLPYQAAREDEDERHVHPLQLDVIDRAIILWSNPGERVLSPFAGVGSEVYGAVRNGRFGIGAELKSSYYRQMVKNVARAKEEYIEQTMPLFADIL